MQNRYREYYAAANGFTGFRSYFEEVFPSEAMSGIFILKGGPGTGKSTLMKKILNLFSEKGYKTDAVFCSSDPHSLDGAIIDGRVAILDGTAPHEMDTRLPGALDEIINLGEGWSWQKLKSSRKKIEELNKNKKQNYNSAYKYLSFSGNIHNYKIELLKKLFNFKSAESAILNLTKDFSLSEKKPKRILISAFSKEGLTRRSFSGFEVKKLYSVTGKLGEGELYFDVLKNASFGKFPITIFPSPFSDNVTEGIYFENEKTLFLSNANGGEVIDANTYLYESQDEEIDFLNENEKIYLEKSKHYFKKAAEFHFLLEDIYRDCMNFGKNQEVFEILSEKILKLLSD